VSGDPTDGAEVDIVTTDGTFVGRGLFNGRSQIRVRLYTAEPVPLDDAFFAGRIRAAVGLRHDLLGLGNPEGACRLVFSEGDGLSGLTVDRYGSYLAVQFTSLALAARRDSILDVLQDMLSPTGIVLRTEKGILAEEGLELRDGLLRGSLPDQALEIREGRLRFCVDLRTGQKTGFYLDQRENRRRAAIYAKDRSVADVCCYTGGFSTAIASKGARVVGVDTSRAALSLARHNAQLNDLSDRTTFVREDAFVWLGGEAGAGRRYGMVILDPPRFARSRKGVRQALRAYERLNTLALRCLEPGGILVTCSCSGRVTPSDFAGAVRRGAVAAKRTVRILEQNGQAPDHPVSATCPESAYLKCLICHVG
jgi:23S rRNA (cytosine1962-C5)-methyltransferase